MKNLLSFAIVLFLFTACSEKDLGTEIGNAYCNCTTKYEKGQDQNDCLVKVSEDYKAKQEALSAEEKKAVQEKVNEVTSACAPKE